VSRSRINGTEAPGTLMTLSHNLARYRGAARKFGAAQSFINPGLSGYRGATTQGWPGGRQT